LLSGTRRSGEFSEDCNYAWQRLFADGVAVKMDCTLRWHKSFGHGFRFVLGRLLNSAVKVSGLRADPVAGGSNLNGMKTI
jgi:hypothetical protein